MSKESSQAWVEPRQRRSQQKVERILDATIDLATKRGSLDVKMTEVAKQAEVAVGTLYQFFPERSALIGKLFDREMEPIDERVARLMVNYESFEHLKKSISDELRVSLKIVQSRPGLSIIWSASALDPVVQAADFDNTRKNAATLADRLDELLGRSQSSSEVQATALLVCHLWSSVLRLCVLARASERKAIIEQYANMLASHAESLSGELGGR